MMLGAELFIFQKASLRKSFKPDHPGKINPKEPKIVKTVGGFEGPEPYKPDTLTVH